MSAHDERDWHPDLRFPRLGLMWSGSRGRLALVRPWGHKPSRSTVLCSVPWPRWWVRRRWPEPTTPFTSSEREASS